jgi:hypothetical protein
VRSTGEGREGQPASKRPKGNAKTCWAFAKGSCKFGDKCRFAHEAGGEAATAMPVCASASGEHLPPVLAKEAASTTSGAVSGVESGEQQDQQHHSNAGDTAAAVTAESGEGGMGGAR